MRLGTRCVAYDVGRKGRGIPFLRQGKNPLLHKAIRINHSNLVWEGSHRMSRALGQRETIATTGLADTRWRLPVWALAALLAVVTIAVYGSAIRNGFVD